MAAAPPTARTTLTLTPLARSQFPQVAADLRNMVSITNDITVSNVGRSERGRLHSGASFSFTVPASDVVELTTKTLQAVRFRFGESSSLRAEVFSVPTL
jgi:hypothetical protein